MTTAIDYRLLLVQPRVVFAARCTQVSIPGSAAWYVTYDRVSTGAHTDIRAEMMVLLGTSAGADDLGRARVRKAATSDTIFIGWSSFGRGEGELHIQYDAYITVIDLYKPWTKTPRIENGVQYTDYDRDFASYGHSAPVVNLDCGPAVQRDLDPGTGLATFEFNAIHTYMTDPDAAAMYSAFAWELPAGATVTDGAINTHAVTFTLPEGAWWVSAYETASTGTVGTRRVLCVAGEPSGTLSKWDQLEITRRPEGQTLRVRVSESVPESTYPHGCMAVLWKHQYEDGAAVTPSGLSGHEHIAFVGWHYQDETSGRAEERGFIDDTILEFRDVGGWLQVLPGYPITVNRDQEPASWFELKRANIDYYFARLLLEYTNVTNLTDFIWSGVGYDHYPFPSLSSVGSTLYEQVDGRAQAIAHKLTCDQWSRLHVKPDPQLLDAAGGATAVARTTTVQKALTEAEWSDVQLSAQPFPRANWNWGSAIVAKSVDADAEPQIDSVFCVAPGPAPGQGTATQNTGEQLVTGQAELNAREGHRYAARMNNPYPSLEVVLSGPDDWAIQPAYMTWVTYTNSSATAGQRQHLFSATRLLPIEVAITHDAERLTQRVVLRAEVETTGSDAATYYPETNDYGELPEWELPPTIEPTPGDADLGPGLNKIFLLHESGEVSITDNFQAKSNTGGPSYTVVDLELDGVALDAVTDPYSPLYLGTGTTVNCWIVTTERIYYVTDIADVSSRSVDSQHTFAVASDYRTIQTERGVANWAIVSSYYPGTGVKAARTTDGSTWTETGIVGGSFASGDVFSGSYDWYYDFDFSAGELGWTGYYADYSSGGGYWHSVFDGGGFQCRVESPAATASSTVEAVSVEIEITATIDAWKDGDSPSFEVTKAVGSDSLASAAELGLASVAYGSFTKTVEGKSVALGSGYKVQFTSYIQRFSAPYGGVRIRRIKLAGSGTPPWTAGGGYTPDETGVYTPTVYVSGKVPGTAYIGAVSGSAGKLYKTTNYGASWVAVNLPASDFGQSLGGAIHWPWHNNSTDRLYYWGKFASNAYYAYRTESDGTTKTLITTASGYGPADPKAWSTSATNRQIVALMAYNGTNLAGYLSQSGGDSWALISPAVARASGYTGVHVADDTAILYLFGPGGVAYSGTGGLLIDDRTGDASTSEVIAIGGW